MDSIHSICIVRLSAIGDVCHALSAVQQIQSTYPQCRITWVMGKVEAQLLGDLPGIKVVVFDKKQGFKGMRDVWAELKNHRFDYLLHMQVALRASILTLGIKAKTKLGFSWSRAKEGQWLFTNKKLPHTKAPHVLDNFAQFSQFLGCKKQSPSWSIPISEKDSTLANELSHQPYVVISPAASKDERNWLTERYAQLADHAYHLGLQVILCGGPTDRERTLATKIEQAMQSPAINLIGKTSLKQLTAVLKKAEVVIAPDSGPAHIATTQGTPVIGLYAHSNPHRTGPYNSLGYTVSVYKQVAEEQYGEPLENVHWGARVKGSDLMQKIELEQVIEQLERVLVLRSVTVENATNQD
ncbi:glycosyltransferase family 9 protein [Vibrio sp. ZSDE26]|uniref:Glycosyltransferase family 9 protein n=2 Tax=Vibrio amylolyticus TaxID=2847292 RepID=A0A9X1XHU0_9VIBR|nr:glycosyltransferase family 9 protein [Vibrio amylolyticus]MCK6263267.1 glycosyltransferase family 9 protein [Vibrio amylolyticus]